MTKTNFSKDYLEKLSQRAVAFNDVASYEVEQEIHGVVRDLNITEDDLNNDLFKELSTFMDKELDIIVNETTDLQNELENLEDAYLKEFNKPYNHITYGDDDYTTLDIIQDNIDDVKEKLVQLEESISKLSDSIKGLIYFESSLREEFRPTESPYGEWTDYVWEEDYMDWD